MNTRKRTRIAVGVFDRIDTLGPALEDLDALGLSKDTLILLFEPSALEGALAAGKGRHVDDLPFLPVLFMRGVDGHSGFKRLSGRATRVEKRIIDLAGWIEPRMAAVLGKHVSEGACLLFALAATSEDEQAICGILIRYSLGQVQVHDLWL